MSPGRSVGSALTSIAARPDGFLAVAGAVRDDLVAIDEGVVEIGVARAVGRDRVVDPAAGEHLVFAAGQNELAELRRRCAGVALQREIPAVAGPHAIGRVAAARRRGDVLVIAVAEQVREWTASAGGGAERPAEQEVEQPLRRSRLDGRPAIAIAAAAMQPMR